MSSQPQTSQSQKRRFDTLSEIDNPQQNAEIHVAVQNITPIKKAKSGVEYFDGYVTDGSRQMRFVGFDEELQTTLSSFADTKSPVMVDRCQIKRGRNQDLEILLNSSSKVKPSPKKLDFSTCVSPSSAATRSAKDVKLREVASIDDGMFVNVVANVTSVKPAKPVSTGLVQELLLTDDDSTEMKLSVWDDNIDKFEEFKRYKFSYILVRSFRNDKALMMTRQSSYEQTNSSCTVSKPTRNVDLITLRNFSIIGVQNFVVHYSCVKCSSKLTEKSFLSKCPSCNTVQVLKSASYNATVNVYIVACSKELVEVDDLEAYLLTRCPELQLSYNPETLVE